MKIIVNDKYTFECDYKVKVGDRVKIPTPYWLQSAKGKDWIGEVTSLNSEYDGYCSKVLSKVRTKKIK